MMIVVAANDQREMRDGQKVRGWRGLNNLYPTWIHPSWARNGPASKQRCDRRPPCPTNEVEAVAVVMVEVEAVAAAEAVEEVVEGSVGVAMAVMGAVDPPQTNSM
jgi:hypothetical protein